MDFEKKKINKKNLVLELYNILSVDEVPYEEIDNYMQELNPESIYLLKEELYLLRKYLNRLDLLTKKILYLRYGFLDKVYSYEEITELLGITKNNVIAIEKIGIKKLKRKLK